MSTLFKASLLLTVFFGINKVVALVRQGLIARQFGFSPEIDAFNAANNVPDLLFSLISGGALAVAFIPVLSDYLQKKGYHHSWKLFSIVANFVFLTTGILSVVAAIFADQLVASQFGIAPGFSSEKQRLAADLMRLNLVATLIFSLSGLVMAGLQANKHFLLPAISPILYNVGLIFGSVFLVPYFGVYGLVQGVIIGSILHLGVQIPGLIYYKFRWSASLDLREPGVKQTLKLMGPRILTVLLIQIIFLTRDNLASRLYEGAVTALTYGYFIMQVPETLIGTAIATALFPTLSALVSEDHRDEFTKLMTRSVNVIIAISILTTVILAAGLEYLIEPVLGFKPEETQLLLWTTRAYLAGLLGYCILEVITRAFYSQKNALTPLIATGVRTVLFLILALTMLQPFSAAGLALADSITVTIEALMLLLVMKQTLPKFLQPWETLLRVVIASLVSSGIIYIFITYSPYPQLPTALTALTVGGFVGMLIILKELKVLLRL